MDIENVVKEYRPRLVAFLQTKRTAEDARVFAADCRRDGDIVDDVVPKIFFIMSTDADQKTLYGKDLASVARKLTIGILRHPHNDHDYDLRAVLTTFVAKMKMFEAKNLGRSINRECDELDTHFWTTMWQDMEEGYYDEFMKHVLVLRGEVLQHCSGSIYSPHTVCQFFDMEYIKKNMCLRTYNFTSVFDFLRGFITHKIHDALKPSFNAMCDNFVAETPTSTSNETTVRVLRFLVKDMLDYLHF
jgi:hypothetical protein